MISGVAAVAIWQRKIDAPVLATGPDGDPVGLNRIGEETWLVKSGPIILGTIKGRAGMLRITPGSSSRFNQQRRSG